MAEIRFGAEAEFNPATTTTFTDIACRALDSEKFFIAYGQQDVNFRGKARIGTVSNTDITYGDAYNFSTDKAWYISAATLNANKMVTVYRDDDDANHGTAIIGTITGTTIAFGAETEFLSATRADWNAVAALSTSGFVVAYRDTSDSNHGTAKIGTVSGTTITFGDETEFLAANGAEYIGVAALDETTFVVVYEDRANADHGTAKIGTVSGTTITFGAETEFLAANGATYISVAPLSTSGFVVVYRDEANLNHGTAKIGTVSGTTITFGAETEFLSVDGVDFVGVTVIDNTQFVVTYRDLADSFHGTTKLGTVSGTTITFGSEVEFLDVYAVVHSSPTTLSPSKFVVSYWDFEDSGFGTTKAGIILNTQTASGDLFINGYDTTATSGDLFTTGREVASAQRTLFIYAPPPDLYDIMTLYLGGVSGTPLRIIHHLTRTGDHNPQLIGSLSDGVSSVNIRVWDIVDGINAQVAVTSSGCYAIGTTNTWGWSTEYLPFASGYNNYHYFYEMVADTSEVDYGEFFLTVPEHGRWVYP